MNALLMALFVAMAWTMTVRSELISDVPYHARRGTNHPTVSWEAAGAEQRPGCIDCFAAAIKRLELFRRPEASTTDAGSTVIVAPLLLVGATAVGGAATVTAGVASVEAFAFDVSAALFAVSDVC